MDGRSIVFTILFFGNAAAVISTYYMDDYCSSGTIDLTYVDAIRLRLTSHRHYANSMYCTVNVRTLESNKLMLFFKSINIEGDSPGSCSYDYLQVYDVTPSNIYQPDYVSGLYGKICGYHISRNVHTSSGNTVKLQFLSDSSETGKGFDMIITSFHYGLCDSTEFQCSNGRCIDNSLTCNNYNPCGDKSDCSMEAGTIAGIIVGCVAFATLLTVAVIFYRRRRLRLSEVPHQSVSSVTAPPGYAYGPPAPQQFDALPPYPGIQGADQYSVGAQYTSIQSYPNKQLY